VDRGIQHTVELSGNSNVNSGTNGNPISANQLQKMSATFMATLQAANAKLASNLVYKLNKTREKSNKQTATLEKVTNRQPLWKK
jgi:phage FluMu protein gp41